MNNTTNDFSITGYIIVLCLYGVGIFLHVKIIKASQEEKSLTWKIDISHSITVLILHAHFIYIYTITYLTPGLVLFTGEWLCYISEVMLQYSAYYLMGHSMIISMLKYVIVVYDEKIRQVKDEVKRIFFWINIFHPALQIALQIGLNYDYFYESDVFLVINHCLRKSNLTKTTWYSMCEFAKPVQYSSTGYVLYIFRRTICTTQVVLLWTIAFNVFEIFFYCRIFSYMRR